MDVLLQTQKYLGGIQQAYEKWLAGKTPFSDHQCSEKCTFVVFNKRFPDALGCTQSGLLHLCGNDCDKTVRSDGSTEVCKLTGRFVRTISQTGSFTVSQNVQNLNSTLRNNNLKRKRENMLKKPPKKSAPDASQLLMRKKGAKTRKRGKGRKPKSTSTRSVRLHTTDKERTNISRAIELFLFHRDHLVVKRHQNAVAAAKTSVNNFLRKHAAKRQPVRFPFMVAAAREAIPKLQGRKPIQTNNQVQFVRKFCMFLTNYTAKAFTHFKMVRSRVLHYRITPTSMMPAEIVQSNFENAASNIDHFQFTISFLLHCCKGKRSKYDNRELLPVISFLTIFAPRESDLKFIFEGGAHKTCLKMGLFMDFADQLYSLGLIKTDPSLSPQRLFKPSQNKVGYGSGSMTLVATTVTKRRPKMARAPGKPVPTASQVIHIPPLTTEFATFLSQKGTTGSTQRDYWCLLIDSANELELSIATTDQVQERKDQVVVCIGRWSSKERAEETLQLWDLDTDAAGNGIRLGQQLRQEDQPNIKIYASSQVQTAVSSRL
jgi:hypothetical protein